VLVTHDQEEAMEVADRLAVINHGRLEQVGQPADVYEHPANEFVLTFLGPGPRLDGAWVDVDLAGGDACWVQLSPGSAAELGLQAGARVWVAHADASDAPDRLPILSA
jgi:sulfate/thiosulfate transport system ATP-binding protein